MDTSRSRRHLGLLAVLAAAVGASVAGAVACGGDQKTVEAPPAASASASAATSASASPVASASAAPADTAALAPDPNAADKMFADASKAPAATLKADGLKATGNELAKGIVDAAKKAAPGMLPDGPLASGTVAEKQRIQTDVTFKTGKCYTVVGFSKKVTDLDLHLLVPPGILSAQDTTDDGTPVVGKAPDPVCMMGGTSVTYKLDIFADQGSGDVAVQVYSKALATK